MTPSRHLATTLAAGLICLAGCSALTVPDAPPVSSPTDPVWNRAAIKSNLEFLHSDAVRGRTDASVGYSVAAAYVADRLREYRLQPALGRDFRILYPSARNVVSGARLGFADADSAGFLRGTDFLPDGRSDSFEGVVRSLWMGDVEGAAADSGSVLLWAGDMDASVEERVRRAPIGVIALQHNLIPAPSAYRWDGKAVVQLRSRTVRRILTQTRRDESNPTHRILDRPLELAISASWSRLASGINVVGFLPGKDPAWSDEALILCTHLDAVGSFSGVPVVDLRNFGVEVVAVLEAARQLARFSRLTRIPERTLIVAFVSGGTVDSSGFEELLSSPLWAGDRIRKVIYVGRPEGGVPQAVTGSGVLVPVVNVLVKTDQALPDTLLLAPDVSFGQPGRSRLPTPDDFIDAATSSAEELARRVYVHLAAELMARPGEGSSE